MSSGVEFANLRSRIILSRSFQRQSVIPRRKPFDFMVNFFKWYENTVLRVDTSNIKIDRPIFLLGLPRSGTTMLQDLICAYPDIAYITNTMHSFRYALVGMEDLRKRLGLDFKGERYLADSVDVSPGSPNEGHLLFTDWANLDIYSLDWPELRIEDFTPEQIEEGRELIRRVLWCFGGENKRFFNKNPAHATFFTLLKDIYPDAKFIHLVRDARMCANSMVKLYRLSMEQESKLASEFGTRIADTRPFVPFPRLPRLPEYMEKYGGDDLRTTARLWSDAIDYIHAHRDGIEHFYEVRYEDILADPIVEVGKILDFCELPELQDRNTEFWQKLNQIGVVNHKNKYGDFDLIEDICRDNMLKYGYL